MCEEFRATRLIPNLSPSKFQLFLHGQSFFDFVVGSLDEEIFKARFFEDVGLEGVRIFMIFIKIYN